MEQEIEKVIHFSEQWRNYAFIAAGLIGLPLAWWRSCIASKQTKIQADNHLADTYTKAIDQLGKNEDEVRLGGLYALEKVAFSNKEYHRQIMEVLCSFVRLHAPKENIESKKPANEEVAQGIKPSISEVTIQTALTIISRRNSKFDTLDPMNKWVRVKNWIHSKWIKTTFLITAFKKTPKLLFPKNFKTLEIPTDNTNPPTNTFKIDLNNINLKKANLEGANLQGAILQGANLHWANLHWANLQGAILQGANLHWANLHWANLQGANLQGAILQGAILQGAILEGAILYKANLKGASLEGAILIEANLEKTNILLEQLQSAGVFKSTMLPPNIDKTKIQFADDE